MLRFPNVDRWLLGAVFGVIFLVTLTAVFFGQSQLLTTTVIGCTLLVAVVLLFGDHQTEL